MHTPAMHTPYDGSSPPFHIGLSRIDPVDWIEVDDLLVDYLAEKARLAAITPDLVFAAQSGSEKSQAELLELLAAHLLDRFPHIYRRRCGHAIEILPAGRSIDLKAAVEPLRIAAALVQEDLLLMHRHEDGWRLAAGSLSFPSSWHLAEKFGRLMHAIHAPVPGFAEGSRNSGLIERMFDKLRPGEVMLRWNWGLYDDGQLHHPGAGNGMRRFGANGDTRHVFIRVERQTLRKLPLCNDIVFTIRIHLNPLEALARQPNRRELALSLSAQISALSASELAYKGLSDERDRLLEHLAQVAR